MTNKVNRMNMNAFDIMQTPSPLPLPIKAKTNENVNQITK